MNRINQIFLTKEKLLSIYFTAGYPNLNDTIPILKKLQEAGVDIIEIGLPFSDPLADGPTIQESSKIALNNSYLEKYLLGKLNLELMEFTEDKSKLMADEIIENGIKNRLSEIWGTEATLYYPEKYAGTCDACGVYEGQESIIDFKQSNKLKREEWIEDYYLQLGAYSLAHNVVYNSRITQGIILLCTVDNVFQDYLLT